MNGDTPGDCGISTLRSSVTPSGSTKGEAEIAVEELADKAGTIPYEVLARINPFLPRIIVARLRQGSGEASP